MKRRLRIRPEIQVFSVQVDTFEGWQALDSAFKDFDGEPDEVNGVRLVAVLRNKSERSAEDVMVWLDLNVRKTRKSERVVLFSCDDLYLVACDPALTPREVMDALSS